MRAIPETTEISYSLAFLVVSVYDGNGNVCDYIDASGTSVAHYEYGPYGEITASSGTKKDDFTHRFSSKPWEEETDIIHYELRPYIAEILGRFMARDPIGERGGRNLYGIVENEAIGQLDYLGRKEYDADRSYIGNRFTDFTTLSLGDSIINSGIGTITVLSGNLEDEYDRDFSAGKCVLKELGFDLPNSENGVYWGYWADDTVLGYTVNWSGPFGSDINFSFISSADYYGSSSNNDKATFIQFIVTLYHEVKGHNRGEEDDSDAFDEKYEYPIYDKILEVRRKEGKCCGSPPLGPKKTKTLWDYYLCKCGVLIPEFE